MHGGERRFLLLIPHDNMIGASEKEPAAAKKTAIYFTSGLSLVINTAYPVIASKQFIKPNTPRLRNRSLA